MLAYQAWVKDRLRNGELSAKTCISATRRQPSCHVASRSSTGLKSYCRSLRSSAAGSIFDLYKKPRSGHKRSKDGDSFYFDVGEVEVPGSPSASFILTALLHSQEKRSPQLSRTPPARL